MYGFRVPFKAAAYDYQYHLSTTWLLDEKSVFVIAQVLGYTISKFIGIKVVSELAPDRRSRRNLGLDWFFANGTHRFWSDQPTLEHIVSFF